MNEIVELPSLYQQFIFLRSYSRWAWEKIRREHWNESVARYFDYHRERVPKKLLPLYEETQQYVLNGLVMPSMRALWSAGPALDHDNLAAYNCLGGDTLVTTREYGIVPIGDLEDKEAHVVDGNGEWTLAGCSSYGRQDVYEIEYADSVRTTNRIKATLNHNWVMRDGSIKITSELVSDDQFAFTSMPQREIYDEDSADYKKGIVHGIVYGDGTAIYKYSSGSRSKDLHVQRVCNMFVIRLCGRSRELLSWFDGYPCSYPKSFNGDPVIYLKDCAIDLKSPPHELMNNDYMMGFLRGWMAADGSVGILNSDVVLSCVKEGAQWLYKYGPKYGFVVLREIQRNDETNYGKRGQTLYSMKLDRRWLCKEDFILKYKKERFKEIDLIRYPGFAKFVSLRLVGMEKVYCFNVPTTHSFLLTKNVLTGNCAYTAVNSPDVFGEVLYILMNGAGCSFSVERQSIADLPVVPNELTETEQVLVAEDSKEGWATVVKEFTAHLYEGFIFQCDLSKVRPEGAILRTFGGRASGPKPLKKVLDFTKKTFIQAKGRKLNSIECHDLLCVIAECVESGGVRRSSCLSLSNPSDQRMQHAKDGVFWETHPYRKMANNSAAYTEKPDMKIFMEEWLSLALSGTGERGIFNRESCKKIFEMNGNRRELTPDMGTNPCSEIILRSKGLCNLSVVVVRPGDSLSTLLKKNKMATLLGMVQATLTDFHFIGPEWKKNAEEERLLGVSLTGTCDHAVLNQTNPRCEDWLSTFKNGVVDYAKRWAPLFGINVPAATTCIKPNGTVSQLLDTASGIHLRHSEYYIRRVRVTGTDPIATYLKDKGFPWSPEVGQSKDVCTTAVFDFPFKSPKGAILTRDRGALQQLEYWKQFQLHYCEHKPSYTCYVKPDEWLEVGAWVYKNWDIVSGIAFLPDDGGIYELAPYEEITKQQYEKMVTEQPKITFDGLADYEKEDYTSGARELSCFGSTCEL